MEARPYTRWELAAIREKRADSAKIITYAELAGEHPDERDRRWLATLDAERAEFRRLAERAAGELEAAAAAYRRALEWLVNLAHGVGKAGGAPEPGEFEAAAEAGQAALSSEVGQAEAEVIAAAERLKEWNDGESP